MVALRAATPRRHECDPRRSQASCDAVGTRILSVEDDERIRTAVKLALEDEGWTVDEAGSGEEAIELFHRTPPDVVLIDIMLPGIDGFELCRTLRRTSDVPIVMVTARNDTHDVVAGLEAGADDYLTKPFAPKELSARIRALLRRVRPVAARPRPAACSATSRSIPDEGKVLRDGDEVHLTKTEFRLLCELAQNPGRVFSRESAARQGVGLRLLRRRPARRRARPPAAHQGRGRRRQPAPRRDRARARVPPPDRDRLAVDSRDRRRSLDWPSPSRSAEPRREPAPAAGRAAHAHHADVHARRVAAVDVPRRHHLRVHPHRASSASARTPSHRQALTATPASCNAVAARQRHAARQAAIAAARSDSASQRPLIYYTASGRRHRRCTLDRVCRSRCTTA